MDKEKEENIEGHFPWKFILFNPFIDGAFPGQLILQGTKLTRQGQVVDPAATAAWAHGSCPAA